MKDVLLLLYNSSYTLLIASISNNAHTKMLTYISVPLLHIVTLNNLKWAVFAVGRRRNLPCTQCLLLFILFGNFIVMAMLMSTEPTTACLQEWLLQQSNAPVNLKIPSMLSDRYSLTKRSLANHKTLIYGRYVSIFNCHCIYRIQNLVE